VGELSQNGESDPECRALLQTWVMSNFFYFNAFVNYRKHLILCVKRKKRRGGSGLISVGSGRARVGLGLHTFGSGFHRLEKHYLISWAYVTFGLRLC
jgi:hypothetical protein